MFWPMRLPVIEVTGFADLPGSSAKSPERWSGRGGEAEDQASAFALEAHRSFLDVLVASCCPLWRLKYVAWSIISFFPM